MSSELKKMYRTVMDDHFPAQITISFGDQELVYRKRTWKIQDGGSGDLIEKGLRYGGTLGLKQLFSKTGLKFDFSPKTVEPLLTRVYKEWEEFSRLSGS